MRLGGREAQEAKDFDSQEKDILANIIRYQLNRSM
jgi:hypothetical protein